jgi:hypothetical protein
MRARYGGPQPSLRQEASYGGNSTQFSRDIDETIANLASSAPEPPEVDVPNNIPSAPVPGKPEKLARFSRSTVQGQEYFTDKQVLGYLVREGKANQNRVNCWMDFIKERGVSISIHI